MGNVTVSLRMRMRMRMRIPIHGNLAMPKAKCHREIVTRRHWPTVNKRAANCLGTTQSMSKAIEYKDAYLVIALVLPNIPGGVSAVSTNPQFTKIETKEKFPVDFQKGLNI